MNNNIVNYKYVNSIEEVAYVALVVRVGSLDDIYSGCAHLLEHTLIMSLNEREELDISKYNIRAFTDFDRTIFLIKCPNRTSCIEEAQEIIYDIYSGKYLHECYMNMAKIDVIEEIKNSEILFEKIIMELVSDKSISKHMPKGNILDVELITIRELTNFFNELYKTREAFTITVGKETLEDAIGILNVHKLNLFNEKNTKYEFVNMGIIRLDSRKFICLQENVQLQDVKGQILQDLIEYICTVYVNERYQSQICSCYYMRIVRGVNYFVMDINDDIKNVAKDIFDWLTYKRYLRIVEAAEKNIYHKKKSMEGYIYEAIEYIDVGIGMIPDREYIKTLNKFKYEEVRKKLFYWINGGGVE